MKHRWLAGLWLGLPWVASAHTALHASAPASGSILQESPAALTLQFAEETRLTAVTLQSREGERALAFTPADAALEFTSTAPRLAVGRNAIVWRALSLDGHVVEGTIILVLKPQQD